MSKLHSTLSRRDFMKGLGLAGAGLGAVAAAAPVFHDMDEVMVSSNSNYRRPWWVKDRDYGNPTVEIDWNILDYAREIPSAYGPNPNPWGELRAKAQANREHRKQQGVIQGIPGFRVHDLAVTEAAEKVWHQLLFTVPPRKDQVTAPLTSGFPNQGLGVNTPEYYGVPRWEGTPEENLRLLRSAAHLFGSPQVHVTEIDDNTRKLFYKTVRWENIDKPYQDGQVWVMPDKCKWQISLVMKQNDIIGRSMARVAESGPTQGYANRLQEVETYLAYDNLQVLMLKLQYFLIALGYMGIEENYEMTLTVPWSILNGLGEASRATIANSPEYGLAMRRPVCMFTDLPLAPTPPVDAGIFRFCRDCGICANNCPSGGLSKEKDPSWEVNTYKGHDINRAGFCGYRCDLEKTEEFGCPFDCAICQNICPFNHPNQAIIHTVVRATVSNTSMLNSFFATMEESAGYRKTMTPDEWWDRDLNSYRGDSLYGFPDAYPSWA